ncbi:hypothetical protein ACG74X_14330 [Marivita sp. S0852]|uniref:hypothetical protein n=1 Tax=Marivita sp. S0852 TaxID=3373893 RepID=UPI0039825101
MKTLTLTLRTGPAAGTARMTDGSRPFHIGTAPGSTWTLPASEPPDTQTADSSVSIRRSGDHFLCEATGRVELEGRVVPEGAEMPLHHGSELGIGGHRLVAHVDQSGAAPASGGPTDAFQEAALPTISAILSDVSPGGDGASGPLPGRTGEEWLDSFTVAPQGRKPTRPEWDRLGAWGEAPEGPDPLESATQPDPLGQPGKILPDDWDAPISDTGNRMVQAPSNQQSFRIADAPAEPDISAPNTDIRVLREAAGLYEGEVDAPDDIQLANAGTALNTALTGLGRLEAVLDRVLADFDLPARTPDAVQQATLDPGAILSDQTGEACLALARRIDAIEARQTAVIEACLATVEAARTTFDPETIRAAVAAKGDPLDRVLPTRAAWAEHCRRWTQDEQPLDSGTLRASVAQRLDGQIKEP